MLQPLVEELTAQQDNWQKENELVKRLEPYSAYMPDALIEPYVSALTMTYVRSVGRSSYHNRTNFFADGAALRIPKMFQTFDDKAAAAFVKVVQNSVDLRSRIQYPIKMERLRTLGELLVQKVSVTSPDMEFLNVLVDPAQERMLLSFLKFRS